MSEPLWGANLLSLDVTAPVGWVAQLHLYRDLSASQLQQMYANGQRCARVVMCFYHGAADGINLDSTGSHFTAQQEQNLEDLVQMLADQGFQEIELALMPQAHNSFWNWPAWDEEMYQENWNLIVFPLLGLAGKAPIPVRIDLNNELVIGTDVPVAQQYRRRLWENYTYDAKLPLAHTVGFSIDPTPLAFAQLPDIYGPIMPEVHSVHIYRGVQSAGWLSASDVFVATDAALTAHGYRGPIEIGETGYNEPEIRRELILASMRTGRSIRKIMQWPGDARLPQPTDPNAPPNALPLAVPTAIPL